MTDMAATAPLRPPRREWGTALRALRRLLDDKDDTGQVFEIMRALNGSATRKGYARMLSTLDGGRIAYQRVELAERLSDRDWLAGFAPGTLAAVYRDFTDRDGVTPGGLVEVSSKVMMEIEHPIAWYGRRIRDSHDLWHVLTGHNLDRLGEAGLVAFSYAQTRALGWAVIATGAALRYARAGKWGHVAAIRQGYGNGRRARWLSGEDYLALLALPIDEARRRLGVLPPTAYLAVPEADR